MKKAGIIGGSGFIGSYVTKMFLDNGYSVKVSSTDTSKKEKYQHLMDLAAGEKLEIAGLNVEEKEALRDAEQSCAERRRDDYLSK